MDTTRMGLGRNPELGACAIRAEAEISSTTTMIRLRVTFRLRLKMVDWLGVWRLALLLFTMYSLFSLLLMRAGAW